MMEPYPSGRKEDQFAAMKTVFKQRVSKRRYRKVKGRPSREREKGRSSLGGGCSLESSVNIIPTLCSGSELAAPGMLSIL
jgi:hypothetical protein